MVSKKTIVIMIVVSLLLLVTSFFLSSSLEEYNSIKQNSNAHSGNLNGKAQIDISIGEPASAPPNTG
jgi:hypothetical protein